MIRLFTYNYLLVLTGSDVFKVEMRGTIMSVGQEGNVPLLLTDTSGCCSGRLHRQRCTDVPLT